MNKTIGILAHVDAGKTTFSEQILYHTKTIKQCGRVDHGDSFLDNNNIEKERGITIFSEQAVINYNSSVYYLIDTPGHMDFSPEMERCIHVLDYAIIIINAVSGIEGQTETIWNLLRKNNVPAFFFINKIDREGADVNRIVKQLQNDLTKDICFINESSIDKFDSEEIVEFIAERDECLLEKYINGDFDKNLWLNSMKKMIKEGKIFPCLCGSALKDIGIEDFLKVFDMLTFTDYCNTGSFGGRVYKIRYDDQGNKVTFIKALNGTLKVKDEINCGTSENSELEKVDQIRVYNGNKFKTVEKVCAGEVFGVTGLKNVKAGFAIGNISEKANYEIVPVLRTKVVFNRSINEKEVLSYFKILEEEEPALNVIWNEALHEIEINIMGTIQLEVLKEIVKDRFNILIDFGPCEILYKETIKNSAYGCGHFEPLRHYAEVHLKLEPGKRGSGIQFSSKCSPDVLSVNFQNLIRTHIFERKHHGVLTGSELTDINVILVKGRSHIKHTSGGDFRQATFRALRQGLENAENILLEPYYHFKIEADIDYMGKILSDIQRLDGTFNQPETINNKVIITGRGTVSSFMNYSMEFSILTKGKGKISLIFDGYDTCKNQSEIIEKIKYNKDSDPEYTSSSVFCSKGKSFTVKGSEALEYMHC